MRLRRSFTSKLLALISLSFLGSAIAMAQSTPRYDCTPSFPYKQQWFGADAAYSIPLLDGRDVWVFGDTLYGDKREVTGDDPRMVHNSIGISSCNKGHWNIDYTLRRVKNGQPTSFFAPQGNSTWYWALDGALRADELWVSLLCVRNAPKTTSAALGFEICGTDLAHVTGINAAPKDWKVSYLPLVPEALHANPSASAVIEGDYLYLFTLYELGTRPTILTRIPLKGLKEPQRSLEYLGGDNEWHSGLVPEKAKVVMEHGASEMSVRYHPELKQWVAVLVDPTMFSDKVLLRTSPAMQGPWTPGDVIYRIPEMQKNSPDYDPDTFCYAGKEHPEFEKAGELVFTYVCNTMKPKKLEKQMNIYHPIVVRMKMPVGSAK